MKVLLINNNPMDKQFEAWKKGLHPGHHLWGKIELDRKKTIDIDILRHEKYPFLNKLGNLFNIEHLDQQIRTYMVHKKYDIIYSPYAAANTKLLMALKYLGLFRTPMVFIIHQPFMGYNSNSRVKKWLAKKLLLQIEGSVFFSRYLLQDTIEKLQIPEPFHQKHFFHSCWGADMEFYKKYATPIPVQETEFAIAVGTTDRDFDRIIEAFKDIDFPLKIFCTPNSKPKSKKLPPNVTVYSKGISYFELLEHYNKSRVILIPLKRHNGGVQGLTNLLDAFALGKPVVMTYNKVLDIDLERDGLGLSVKQDDVEDWKRKIKQLIYDYDTMSAMSKKSKSLFLSKYNTNVFANDMESIFQAVMQKP